MADEKTAIIAGVGPGLSTSLVRAFVREGYRIGGLARSEENMRALTEELGADKFTGIATDLTSGASVETAVNRITGEYGPVSLYVHNVTAFLMKPYLETKSEEFEMVWRSAVLGTVHGTQAVLPGMLAAGSGVILITGATASVRGGADFSAFASAKFALRGLSQSLARQFGPQGVHVAHILIDGVIRGWSSERFDVDGEKCLDPDAIAQVYVDLSKQPKSCWTHELDIRPGSESF